MVNGMAEDQATAVARRVLPAPPDVVYDAWLDAEGMLDWMCPRPARPTKIELEPRPGGGLCLDIDFLGFLLQSTGTYLELDRPHRISFTWRSSVWNESDGESVVTVTFEPHGDGQTLMTIRHTLPAGMAENYEQGWTRIAGQLDDQLLTTP
jgi:uncharacterized protein YndB with AHSA1/START domain